MTAPRRLRVLYLADARSIHTQRWVAWFGRRHDVLVIHVGRTQPDPSGLAFPLARGTPDYRIPLVSAAALVRHARRVIRDFRPDFVHAHFLVPNAWIAAATGFRRVVTTTWGSDLLLAGSLSRTLSLLALRRAVLNTADSQDVVSRLAGLLNRTDTVRLIQFGVDTDAFAPGPASGSLREAWRVPADARVVLSPRLLRELYNGLTVARAFVEVAPRHPDLHLVFLTYNADAEYQAQVRAVVERAGLGARVTFAPAVAHHAMPDLYREAAVVLSVPNSDATPVTLLEAMACGAVPMASDLPSVREWLSSETGFLVPPGETAPLVAALEAAFRLSPSNRLAMLETNRRTVVARASQDAELGRLERELLDLAPAAT